MSPAASGIKKVWLAQILTVLGLVCVILGLALEKSNTALTGVFGLAGIVLVLACAVLEIVGLGIASKAHENYKNAFILVIGFVAVTVILGVLDATVLKGKINNYADDFITDILELLVAMYVIRGTMDLLTGKGENALAARGSAVLTVLSISLLLKAALELAGLFVKQATVPAVAVLIIGIVILVFRIVGIVLYMTFLGKSWKKL